MGSDGWPISALESAGLRWLRPAGRLPGLPASAASLPAPAAAAAASVLLQRERGLPAAAASRLRQPEGAWQQRSVPARPNEQTDERREAAAGAASGKCPRRDSRVASRGTGPALFLTARRRSSPPPAAVLGPGAISGRQGGSAVRGAGEVRGAAAHSGPR